MSLRIKLPALKPPPRSPTPTVMEWSEEPRRKRKRTKRYMGSDDDLVAEIDLATEASVVDKPRRRDSLIANSDVDVVGENEYEQDDQRSEPSSHIIAKPSKAKSKGKAAGDGPPARKKSRRVVTSDPETEDEYLEVVADAVDSGREFDDDNENDYFPPEPKLTTKGFKGKGKASPSGKGGAKRRAKVDNPPEVSTTSKKRPKPTHKPDEVFCEVAGDGSSTPNVSIAGDHSAHTVSKQDSPPPSAPTPHQPPPRKQKLPTIKKVKLPTLNIPASTIVKDTVALPLGSKPTQDGARKPLTGTSDIDLSNKSIYEEIFSKTGQGDGGTTRGGNRRTKEEERRKELNRQRDEAKAKRALEAQQTFDLQAQFDRISRFEEKLKAEHSSALYPNFLAAKWREEWEKEKRRQKGKDWHDSIYSHEPTTREEGEVR